MKRVILKSVFPVIGLLTLFILAFILVESDSIQHYRQYLIPIEGRISTYANAKTTLPFYFLDEKEISELAQKDNLQSVSLVSRDGSTLVAEDWEVSLGDSFYAGKAFSSKELKVTITPRKTKDYKFIVLQYPDKVERYEIGDLQVYVVPKSRYEPYFQAWSTFSGEGTMPVLSQEDKVLDYKEGLSYGVFTFIPARNTRILGIDLGISGIGLHSNSIIQIPSDFDFGLRMSQDPFYSKYLHLLYRDDSEGNDTAPLNLEVNESVTYLSRIMTSQKSLAAIKIYYLSPMIHCLDTETGEQFIYAETNCSIVGIRILDDSLAGELLAKDGK